MTHLGPGVVLDASSVLAWLFLEPGGEQAGDAFRRSRISALNWSEVLQKSMTHGLEPGAVGQELIGLGISVETFTEDDAAAAAALWAPTKTLGLSLADRACLVLGQRLASPVLTADQNWSQLSSQFTVQLLDRPA